MYVVGFLGGAWTKDFLNWIAAFPFLHVFSFRFLCVRSPSLTVLIAFSAQIILSTPKYSYFTFKLLGRVPFFAIAASGTMYYLAHVAYMKCNIPAFPVFVLLTCPLAFFSATRGVIDFLERVFGSMRGLGAPVVLPTHYGPSHSMIRPLTTASDTRTSFSRLHV